MQSDLILDTAKLGPEAISDAQTKFNEQLISILNAGPMWFDVGAEQYRVLRREGKTPLPGPTVIDSGIPFSIPSRDNRRQIPCRIMKPEGDRPVKGAFAHIHGGGWVLQSEKDQDPLIKGIADGANVVVVSIGYRLAPEHPFPQGPEDCFDVAEWLVDNAEKAFGVPLLFMGGESAGGHLSLLTLFRLQQTKPEFHFSGLILNFGAYDLSFLPMARNFSKPLVLTPKIMDKYMDAFLPGVSPEDRKDPSMSPFYKDLTGLNLPPALFTCGTEDCLLDDTLMMGLKWQMSGAEAIVRLFPGAPHGFVLFPPEKVAASKECLEDMLTFLKMKLNK